MHIGGTDSVLAGFKQHPLWHRHPVSPALCCSQPAREVSLLCKCLDSGKCAPDVLGRDFCPRKGCDTFSSPLLCTGLGFWGGDSGRVVELPAVTGPSGKVIGLQMLIREQTEARDY